MKTSDGRIISVNLVCGDRLLVERVRASLGRSPFDFCVTAAPDRSVRFDLFVVPVELADGLVSGDGAACGADAPVIAYGKAAMLRAAFLLGCADYLREPWSADELAARGLAAVGRARRSRLFPWGELAFDGREVAASGGTAALSVPEARILEALLAFRGTAVTRDALSYRVSGKPHTRGSRSIDVQVSSLRRKLAAVAREGKGLIVPVRGLGYMIR